MPEYYSSSGTEALAAEIVRLPQASKLSGLGPGTLLFSPGDPCDRVFVLVHGSVKLCVTSGSGRQCIFHLVRPGECFGEVALIGAEAHWYGAETLETASVFSVPLAAVSARIGIEPYLWRRCASLLHNRLKRTEERLLWLTFLDVKQRVARLLLSFPRSENKKPVLRISQKDLAAMIGATRETASGVLSALQREGCIRTQRRRIEIVSVENLLKHAGELPAVDRAATHAAGL